MLKKMIKNLEKLKNEEMTLLQMDNEVRDILEAHDNPKISIFDGETEDFIEMGEYAYTTWADEEERETADINVKFKVLEEDENIFDILVKITEIELL